MLKFRISGLTMLSVVVLLALQIKSTAQDVEGSMVYSVNLVANPAFTGSEGTGMLRLTYRDYYPGQNLNLRSVYLGYDTYSEAVHGGIGLYLLENSFGEILNDFRAGANYAYHLQLSRELYLNAGFNAGFLHRSVNRERLIFPDQIDPILGPVLTTGESPAFEPRLMFDLGVGFLLSYRSSNAGISVMHLGKPDLAGTGSEDGKLKRRVTVHGSTEFETGYMDLKISPIISMNFQDRFSFGAAGAVVSHKPLSLIMLAHFDLNNGFYSFQPGFSFETGRFLVSYNYFLSPFYNSSGLPATQSNLISIKVSLNNVDKRGVLKAINCPKL